MKLCFKIILITTLLASCSGKEHERVVLFDVGFENLKFQQGIINAEDPNKEEVYFFKSDFDTKILFYTLNGEKSDSISLVEAEKQIGRINYVSVISKDSIIIISSQSQTLAGVNRNQDIIFRHRLSQLLTDEFGNKYRVGRSIYPTAIISKNNELIIATVWDSSEETDSLLNDSSSSYEWFYAWMEGCIKSFQMAIISNIYDEKNTSITFYLKDYYSNLHPDKIKLYLPFFSYIILNNSVIYANPYDRYIHIIKPENSTNSSIKKVEIIPSEYTIPQGFELTYDYYNENSKTLFVKEMNELNEKSYITNILISEARKKIYFFVKTGVDKSQIDELGYPFKVFVYNYNFEKEPEEFSFETDEYHPRSAFMTSKGVMIEKIDKTNEYGKKTFAFFDF